MDWLPVMQAVQHKLEEENISNGSLTIHLNNGRLAKLETKKVDNYL